MSLAISILPAQLLRGDFHAVFFAELRIATGRPRLVIVIVSPLRSISST